MLNATAQTSGIDVTIHVKFRQYFYFDKINFLPKGHHVSIFQTRNLHFEQSFLSETTETPKKEPVYGEAKSSKAKIYLSEGINKWERKGQGFMGVPPATPTTGLSLVLQLSY